MNGRELEGDAPSILPRRSWWVDIPTAWRVVIVILAATSGLFGLGVGWTVKAQVYSTLPPRMDLVEQATKVNRTDIDHLLQISESDTAWKKRYGCLIEAMALKVDPIQRCGL